MKKRQKRGLRISPMSRDRELKQFTEDLTLLCRKYEVRLEAIEGHDLNMIAIFDERYVRPVFYQVAALVQKFTPHRPVKFRLDSIVSARLAEESDLRSFLRLGELKEDCVADVQ